MGGNAEEPRVECIQLHSPVCHILHRQCTVAVLCVPGDEDATSNDEMSRCVGNENARALRGYVEILNHVGVCLSSRPILRVQNEVGVLCDVEWIRHRAGG